MALLGSTSLTRGRAPAPPRPGDYLTDGRNLFWIEELFEEHALIEDCRTGVLIDVDLKRLHELAPVRSASEAEDAGEADDREGG